MHPPTVGSSGWQRIGRWRPFIVVVAGVVAVAAFPATRVRTEPAETAGIRPATELEASAPDEIALDGAERVQDAAANGTRPTAESEATGSAPAGARRSEVGTATPVSPSNAPAREAGGFPGTGSPAAMANPRCDPQTGRIRIPLRYAPPCVRPWPAGSDNGGVTSPGVTATEIRLVLYDPPPTSGVRTETQRRQALNDWQAYVDIFNAHYEFWGRRIKVIYVEGSGRDEVAQRSDAIRIATDIKPFFVTVNAGAVVETFSGEAAARGIVVINQNVPWAATQKQAPFRWASTADERTVIAHFAEYAGKRLAGRPARWAGNPTYRSRPRAFGLVYPEGWDRRFIDGMLAANNVRLANASTYVAGDVTGAQERARTLVARMKSDGVTSVIAGTDYLFTVVLTREATNQLYDPEWVMTGWAYQDIVLFARLFDQRQWANAFGPGPVMVLPPAENYETSGWEEGSIWHWHYGDSRRPEAEGQIGSASSVIVPFAACVQLAGPTLTPTSFRDGCFAYPPTGGAHCGCVMTTGFSFGQRPGLPWLSYTAWDDMAEKWWDPSATGADEAGITPTGGYYRRVDGGKRYAVSGWPRGEPRVFDPQGTVTWMSDYPPSERPPQYERPRA